MKKQVIKSLLLVFISFVCQAQMVKTNYIGEPFNYVSYTSPCNTQWVIIQPGQGAASYSIETVASIGYGKLAQKQILPFNLLIVQAKKGTSIDNYTPISKNWSSTFTKLGITRAFLTGYSLGGQETIRQLWTDNTGVFVGFIAMCGQYPYGPEAQLKTNVVSYAPIFLLAGDKDAAISWYQSNTVSSMVNRVHPGQATMIIIPGGSHSDAWIKGYDPNNEFGKLVWNFITSK